MSDFCPTNGRASRLNARIHPWFKAGDRRRRTVVDPPSEDSTTPPSSSHSPQTHKPHRIISFEEVATIISIYKVAKYWRDVTEENDSIPVDEKQSRQVEYVVAEQMVDGLYEKEEDLLPVSRLQLRILWCETHFTEVCSRLRPFSQSAFPESESGCSDESRTSSDSDSEDGEDIELSFWTATTQTPAT